MPFADNQGVRIHYQLEGQGPPLALLHGFSMTSEDWREYGYVAKLRDQYTLILIDARGYGASDKPHDPEAYLWQPLTKDVIAVLDELCLSQAHVWGWSWGGAIAFALADYAPERLSRIIIGGASAPPAYRPDQPDGLLELLEEGGAARLVEVWKQHLVISAEHEVRLRRLDVQALKAECLALTASLEDTPPRMTMPCLLYIGEAEDDYAAARNDSQRIPDARFISFPMFNHFDTFARSDVVLAHVLEFLGAGQLDEYNGYRISDTPSGRF